MELTNVKYLERGLRMSGDKLNADLVRDMEAEIATLRAENELLRVVVEAMARFDGRNNNAALKEMAKEALK